MQKSLIWTGSSKKNLISENVEFEKSSGNVFADLKFENPEELLKANLTAKLASILKKKKITQKEAALILGVNQPRISSLLKGRLDLFSVEMLMHFLQELGQDIEIVITPKPRNRKKARLYVVSNGSGRYSTPIAACSR